MKKEINFEFDGNKYKVDVESDGENLVITKDGKTYNVKLIGGAAKKDAPKAAAPAAAAEAPKAESMDWLIAAVAAFVAQDEEPVSAEAWTPSDILRESPWAKAPRVSKRLSGVNR